MQGLRQLRIVPVIRRLDALNKDRGQGSVPIRCRHLARPIELARAQMVGLDRRHHVARLGLGQRARLGVAYGRNRAQIVAAQRITWLDVLERPEIRGLAHMLAVARQEDPGARLAAEALGQRLDPRRLVAQRLHQAEHAVAVQRRADEGRRHRALLQDPRADRVDLVRGRLAVLDDLLHQPVVVVR